MFMHFPSSSRLTFRSFALGMLALFGADMLSATVVASVPVRIAASDVAPGDRFGAAVAIDGDTAIVGAPNSGAAYIYRWNGAGWTEEAKLLASDGGGGDSFGFSVAISGNTVIVGSPEDNDAGAASGSAYVFVRNGSTWTEQAKLVASDGAATDFHGYSVAISGGTVIVGSPFDDDSGSQSGSAYVYVRTGSTWTQQAKLLASDGAASDQFGWSVAISGGTAIVGSFLDDDFGSASGSAYVFFRTGSTWTEQAKLRASDGFSFDNFGRAVAIDGDTAIIGSRLDDDSGGNSGSAYVFVRSGSTWTQQSKLLATDGAASDEFGFAVAIDGDTAIVGSRFDDDAGANSGSAYVFVRSGSTWTQSAKFLANDGAPGDNFGASVAIDGDTAIVGSIANFAIIFERIGSVWIGHDQKVLAADASGFDQFGWSVAISGNTAIVGSPFDDVAGVDSGSAYVFVRTDTGWRQQARLVPLDPAPFDAFGWSVDIDGDTVIVGAPRDDGPFPLPDSGSAYIFVRSGSTWTQQAKVVSPMALPGEGFGLSVAVDANTVLVGAPFSGNTTFVRFGLAFVFGRLGTTWTQQGILQGSDSAGGDEFGSSVALSGTTAIVGSIRDDVAGEDAGAAYIFVKSGLGWTEESKLLPSDGGAGHLFGSSVAIDVNTALVGAPFSDEASGSAYAFVRTKSVWTEQAILVRPDGAPGDRFGTSVSLDMDVAVVGAPGDNNTGTASIYTRAATSWIQRDTLESSSPSTFDVFGFSAAVSGNTVIVGSPEDDADNLIPNAGAAWFFNINAERLLPFAYNVTLDTSYESLMDAIDAASSNHELIAAPTAIWDPMPIDYSGKSLSIDLQGRIRQPYINSITLANSASLNAASGSNAVLYGTLIVPPASTSTLRAASVYLGVSGEIALSSGGSLGSTGPITADGALSMLGGNLATPSLRIGETGHFTGHGNLVTSVTNDGQLLAADSIMISAGDLTNNRSGSVTIQSGILTVFGNFTSDGATTGGLLASGRGEPTQPGDGFSVTGDYRAGPDASLLMSSDLWRISVGADFDVAINDNARYDMSLAELRIGASSPSTIERMSVDIGANPNGLDRTLPGHFPIGTLRVSGNTATLVDVHDNDGQGQGACEALYVRNLIIEPGATLITNGCPVYYETLTLGGSVDDPANLIRIANCPGDTNGDGVVNFADLNAVLSNFGLMGAGVVGDLNNDGVVNFADLNLVLSVFGTPCE